jgi:hypothetical protein
MGDGSWMETAESTGETIHPSLSSAGRTEPSPF